MKIRDASNTLRTVKSVKMRDGSNALRTISVVKMRDAGNVLRTVRSGSGGGSSGAVLAPALVQGSVYSSGSPRATTNAAYITMSVGAAPYTVIWYPDTDWSAISPLSLTTAFRSPPLFSGDQISASVYAIVTDSLGNEFTTNTISMFAANYYNGPA